MACPPSRPVAFDVACVYCFRVVGTTPLDKSDSSWWSNDKRHAMRCLNASCEAVGESCINVRDIPPELGARWGHVWALAIWLAENEKRQGVLWEYLDRLRGISSDGYDIDDEVDTLPEDAMQLLAVNL